jgi:hypothetical protein
MVQKVVASAEQGTGEGAHVIILSEMLLACPPGGNGKGGRKDTNVGSPIKGYIAWRKVKMLKYSPLRPLRKTLATFAVNGFNF